MSWSVRTLLMVLAGLVPGALSASEAHFVVSDRVIAPAPEPLSANLHETVPTGSRFFRKDMGFEPMIYRTWVQATEDAPHEVHGSRSDIGFWGQLASGALDGAEVDVLRIEDGAMRLVREDRIAEGGFHASGWSSLLGRRLVSPDLGRLSVALRKRLRPEATLWVAVQAVDRKGRVSDPSRAVRITVPKRITAQEGRNDALVPAPRGDSRGSGSSPAAPTGLTARVDGTGMLTLTWDRVGRGLAGTRVLVSDVAPSEHRGWMLELANTTHQHGIRKGDLITIRARSYGRARRGLLSADGWGRATAARPFRPKLVPIWPDDDPQRTWRLAPHEPGTAVEDPGETYLELTHRRGSTTRIGGPTDGGTDGRWYEVLEPGRTYRLEVWLKAEPGIRVRFIHTGRAERLIPQKFARGWKPRPTWRRYVADFTPTRRQKKDAANQTFLEVSGKGTIGIDNLRLSIVGEPYLQLTAANTERLVESGIGTLRTHPLIKTGVRTYDLRQLTNPAGVTSAHYAGTLSPLLESIARVGANPWIQVEPHFSRVEWLGLVEYLAAPFDPATDTPETKPWAARRHAQGRTEPWTDVFDGLYFELGNEVWNSLFDPWVFRNTVDADGRHVSAGKLYGHFHDYVVEVMRSSPYWSDALERKITMVAGGWEVIPRFGADAISTGQSFEMLTTAPYISGWESKSGPPDGSVQSYSKVLMHIAQSTEPYIAEHTKRLRKVNADQDRSVVLGTYEAGPGYARTGLADASLDDAQIRIQEEVMKSYAAGTATVDAYLARAAAGYAVQTYYAFGAGAYWRSHADPHAGGHLYPSWSIPALVWREARGAFLDVEARAVPRRDLPPEGRFKAVDDVPLIGLYATRLADGALAVIALNRQVPEFPDGAGPGVTDVVVDLPLSGSADVTRHTMTGKYFSHNVDSDQVRPKTLATEEVADASRIRFPAMQPGSLWIAVVRARP